MTQDRNRQPTAELAKRPAAASPDVIDQHFARGDLSDFAPALQRGAGLANAAAIDGSNINIVQNGDFSEGIGAWTTLDVSGSPAGTFAADTTNVTVGAQEITFTPGTGSKQVKLTSAMLPIPNGAQALSLSMDMRWHKVSTAKCDFIFEVQFYDANSASVGVIDSPNAFTPITEEVWKTFNVKALVPATATQYTLLGWVIPDAGATFAAGEHVYWQNAVVFPVALFQGVVQGKLFPTSDGIAGVRTKVDTTTFAGPATVGIINTDTIWGSSTILMPSNEKDGTVPVDVVASIFTNAIGGGSSSGVNAFIRVQISIDGGVTFSTGQYTKGTCRAGTSTLFCPQAAAFGLTNVMPTGNIVVQIQIRQNGGVAGDASWASDTNGTLTIQVNPHNPN